jgi:hypothetical protein
MQILLLFILNLIHNQLLKGNGQEFGFLLPTRQIHLSSMNTHLEAVVSVPIPTKASDFLSAVKLFSDSINIIKSIPVFQNTSPYYSDQHFRINELQNKIEIIIIGLQNLASYRQTSVNITEPMPICSLEFSALTPLEAETTGKSLQESVNSLIKTTTITDFDSSDKLLEEKNKIQGIHTLMSNYQHKVMEHLSLLESLSNKIISGSILSSLQTRPCVPSGKLERTNILDCMRTIMGLHCTIQLIMKQTDQPSYTVMEPIKYSGWVITAENKHQHFLLTQEGKLMTAECQEDNHNSMVDSFDLCDLKNYDNECSKGLSQNLLITILKNCNFTQRNVHKFIYTTKGILIQEGHSNLKLKTRTNPPVITDVKAPLPLLISSNSVIEANDGENKLVEYIPKTTVSEETIRISWISGQNLRTFNNYVNRVDISKYFGVNEIIDYIQFTLISLMIPMTLLMIKCLNKTGAKDAKQMLKQMRKENLNSNKQFIN